MKKKGFVAGVLILSTLLMGTGYAYWTDSININTKVSTGDLQVKFLDSALYGQYAGNDQETGWSIIDGVPTTGDSEDGWVGNYYFKRSSANIIGSTDKIDEHAQDSKGYNNTTYDLTHQGGETTLGTLGKTLNGYDASTVLYDTINIDLAKLYPGYGQVYQADIANVGSVAAQLSSITSKVTASNDKMNEMIGVSLYLEREYASTVGEGGVHVDVFSSLQLSPADTFVLGGVTFIKLSSLKALPQATIDAAIKNNELFVTPDNNRMDIYLGVAMDPDAAGKVTTGHVTDVGTILNASNSDAATQNETAKLELKFLWDQFNSDFDDSIADDNLLTDQAQ